LFGLAFDGSEEFPEEFDGFADIEVFGCGADRVISDTAVDTNTSVRTVVFPS